VNLFEDIYRIKGILNENSDPYEFLVFGDMMENHRGLSLVCKNQDKKTIGGIEIAKLSVLLPYVLETKIDQGILDFYSSMGNLDNSVYTHSLEVKEEYRRKGFGMKLFEESERIAKLDGNSRLYAITPADNISSIKLKEKLGWKKSHEINEKILYYKDI
jgi:GNAT superfamily N-acetyltransferase